MVRENFLHVVDNIDAFQILHYTDIFMLWPPLCQLKMGAAFMSCTELPGAMPIYRIRKETLSLFFAYITFAAVWRTTPETGQLDRWLASQQKLRGLF
jgi:hypothetical protein